MKFLEALKRALSILMAGAFLFLLFLWLRHGYTNDGPAWAECERRYSDAVTRGDSSRVDGSRLGRDPVTCGELRLAREAAEKSS